MHGAPVRKAEYVQRAACPPWWEPTPTVQRFKSVKEGDSHGASRSSTIQLRTAFTLLELLIVVGVIGLLLLLIAPAFTTIKIGTDVTSAAYTVKGVLDTARTHAKGKKYLHMGRLRGFNRIGHYRKRRTFCRSLKGRKRPWNQCEPGWEPG
jgi:prepilin-type N-terminal cleavage/methylation domain-containing protein